MEELILYGHDVYLNNWMEQGKIVSMDNKMFMHTVDCIHLLNNTGSRDEAFNLLRKYIVNKYG